MQEKLMKLRGEKNVFISFSNHFTVLSWNWLTSTSKLEILSTQQLSASCAKSVSPFSPLSVSAPLLTLFSLRLLPFSHRTGGWLAEKPGIIKRFEWQTLDVLMAVVSHPTLLGVPQPPSLLTVISHLYITCPKSHPQIVHLMLIEAWILESPRGIDIQFQHHGCATWLFMFVIQFLSKVSIYTDMYLPVLLCNCECLSVVTQALCKWSTT